MLLKRSSRFAPPIPFRFPVNCGVFGDSDFHAQTVTFGISPVNFILLFSLDILLRGFYGVRAMPTKPKKAKYRYDRIQFVYGDKEQAVLDKLCVKFGNVDRQAIMRIAIKRLAEAEGVNA